MMISGKSPNKLPVAADSTVKSVNRKKILFIILVVTAVMFITGGIQTWVFFNKYSPAMAAVNLKLQLLVEEKTSSELLNGVWEQLWSLGTTISPEHDATLKLRTLIRNFNETASIAPKETIMSLASELPGLKQSLPEAADQLARFESSVKSLRDIYVIDYEQLIESMQNPPVYLWPTAGILVEKSGYIRIATYNRAMYLAQTGEMGTARVLLTGLHAAATGDKEFLALIYYGLARIQLQLFVERRQSENYFLALNFLRQGIQADPQLMLARRLLDYLLSQAVTNSFEAEQGDPAAPSEGEAGADPEIVPIF